MRTLLLWLASSSVVVALDCFYCGVFLSAESPHCRGVPGNVTCGQNYGCLSIVGQNEDETYYVEKRCAQKSDNASPGCVEVAVRGIRATQCLCEQDLCNHFSSTTSITALIVAALSIL